MIDPPLDAEKLVGSLVTGAARGLLQHLDYDCKESELRHASDGVAAFAKCHRACREGWTSLVTALAELHDQVKPRGIDFPILTP